MARPEQIIHIEPQNELKFRGPFNVPVTSYMKLTNPTDKKVVFKIKTTAPKKYCVRPNSGILEPKNVIEIAICLQPFIFDPAEKNKHKFMVQTVVAPEDEFCADTLWKDISPEKLMDSKLKCVFEMPMQQEGGLTPKIPVNENAVVEDKVKRSLEYTANNDGSAAASVTPETELLEKVREEETYLRQENLQLKEEILRLKNCIGAVPETTKYTPVATAPPNLSVMYLAVAIAMAICGIIVGKFVL
ncbi:vesicle-associated membrane protein/synaptobrevin-binding protein-like [Chrysoperla carnea]|uniref:vesicle-associated membrane protein/synaptobrevin-binding protein-like n=1 Tax=Chrysoperla carnea TaxID=189513 RepID=UPI001D08FCA2|nr:vesicle-associated membrane protein/synaptobrevin-binding protein-like [Chrysoperla carnea]